MPQRTHFRVGDRVTVHGFYQTDFSKTFRGRVICNNRKSRINHPIIVLVDTGSTEVPESFMTDGRRGNTNKDCYLTLGWVYEEKESGTEAPDDTGAL